MPKLNVFIDGTWLFVQCGPGQSLANASDQPDFPFPLDFSKLNNALLSHIQNSDVRCTEIGDCYFVTSIFSLPDDFDDWPNRYVQLTSEQVERAKRVVHAREQFARRALDARYKQDAIFRPPIREYIIRRLSEGRYQEKQVDTTVVALIVRSAIEHPDDVHVLLTGDADILPAVRVAYPAYTRNVAIATTHPDELQRRHRQTAFALLDFDFRIPPFFLQDKADKLIEGIHVHRCGECGKVFSLANPLPKYSRPYCKIHRPH